MSRSELDAFVDELHETSTDHGKFLLIRTKHKAYVRQAKDDKADTEKLSKKTKQRKKQKKNKGTGGKGKPRGFPFTGASGTVYYGPCASAPDGAIRSHTDGDGREHYASAPSAAEAEKHRLGTDTSGRMFWTSAPSAAEAEKHPASKEMKQ